MIGIERIPGGWHEIFIGRCVGIRKLHRLDHAGSGEPWHEYPSLRKSIEEGIDSLKRMARTGITQRTQQVKTVLGIIESLRRGASQGSMIGEDGGGSD